MSEPTNATFSAALLRPVDAGPDAAWAFVVLPKEVSAKLPRRGRTTVAGTIDGVAFEQTLEPDGQLSHWLRVDAELLRAAGADHGDVVRIDIAPVAPEPEPSVPPDLQDALLACPQAQATWAGTTTVARLDWIHWITSAKLEKTRAKRIAEACDKLGGGQRRVCCFDPSGYYSKAFKPPRAADPGATRQQPTDA